jgi:hypothetical protein
MKKLIKNNKKINQQKLFNPELFLTLNNIKERFGKNVIGYGNDTSDYKSNKVLESRNINLLRKNADELLKQYQKLDKEIILYSKVKNIKVNIHKKNLLEKEKERIRILYVKIRERIINIVSNGNE